MKERDFCVAAQERYPASYVASDAAGNILAHGSTLAEAVAAVQAAGQPLEKVRFTYVEPPDSASCYEACRSS